MNIFVWEYHSDLTKSYHGGGGLLIVAKDLDRAKEIFSEQAKRGEEDYRGLSTFPHTEPSHTWPVSDDTEEVLLSFPDSGCC